MKLTNAATNASIVRHVIFQEDDIKAGRVGIEKLEHKCFGDDSIVVAESIRDMSVMNNNL